MPSHNVELTGEDEDEGASAGRYTVRAVDRALELLMAFTRGQSDYTLAELARASGLGKPTVHRLVRTLEDRGFVERRSDGRYTLGATLATLGLIAVENRELSQLVAPVLHDVMRRTTETASCTVLDGHEMVTVASVAGMHRLRYAVYPGERVPASLTADGKIMLAELAREDVLRRVAEEVQPSGRRVTRSWLRQLVAELEQVREAGVCYDLEGEFEPGIACIAVPLRNHRGDVIAALALTVPAMRLSEARVSTAAAAMREAARAPIPWAADRP
jgi:IclR family KDG regulon transcriptional repressor